MTDETRDDDATTGGDAGAVTEAPEPPRRRRRKWPWILLAVILFVPVLIADRKSVV